MEQPTTIAVAWFERPAMRLRWCRALRKTTTGYQDHVRTACGYTITLPCGLAPAQHQEVDCEECLARE